MKKSLSILLAVLIMALCLGGISVMATGNAAEVEPNSTLATGTMTTLGAPTTGALATKDDVDCYKFEIKERGYFTFTFDVDKLTYTADDIKNGWNVNVYTADGSKVIYGVDGAKEKFTSPKVAFEPGIYYVRVSRASTSSYNVPENVTYSVQVNFTADAYWEDEHNESREQAEKIALNTSYTGTLWSSEDVDYYEFDIAKAGFFSVAFDVNKLEFSAEQIDMGWDLGVYDANGKQVYSITGLKNSFTTPHFGLGKGKFYIGVKTNSEYSAPINVQYAVKALFTASTVWESENNDSRDVADSIKVGTKYTANMLNSKDVDYFKFNHANAGYFRVSLYIDKNTEASAVDQGFNLSVYDTAGKEIYTATDITATYTTPVLPFATGTYYIGVKANSTYSAPVLVDYQVAAKETKSTAWEIEHNNATTTATPIKHNTQYYGNMLHSKDKDYYKLTLKNLCQISANLTVNAKFTSEQIDQGWKITIYDTKGNTVFTATDIVKNTTTAKVILKKGTYYVAVTADSIYSAPTLVTYGLKLNVKLAPPTVTVKSVGAKSLKLSWNSLGTGVTYKVYRATTAKGTYKLVKTTTEKSFTDTNVSYGSAYYYKVIGSTSATAGTNSAVKKATVLAKATISKVKSAADGVNIKIAAVKGATGYTVYRCTTKTGTFKKIGTTKTTTYVDTTAKLGTVYYYKVRANGVNNGYGAFSAVVSGRALATPKVTEIKSTAKGIYLKFAAIKGAVSYDIYRSTSSYGTFKKIANVKTTSYTDTNVKDNTAYYYKIVARDANGGVSAMSAYSYCWKSK